MSEGMRYGWTPGDWQEMALGKIHSRLKHDRKDMFKRFSCASMFAETVKEAMEMKDMADKMYRVTGFLALDDSGTGRAFDFLIEKGLSWAEANDLADQLALQVDQAADRMIADRKAGRS